MGKSLLLFKKFEKETRTKENEKCMLYCEVVGPDPSELSLFIKKQVWTEKYEVLKEDPQWKLKETKMGKVLIESTFGIKLETLADICDEVFQYK